MRWALTILLLLCLILTGCCEKQKPEIRYVTQEVKVPVTQPCPVKMPERPRLRIEELTSTSPPDQVAKAAVATNLQLMSYSRELETLLGVCVGKPK